MSIRSTCVYLANLLVVAAFGCSAHKPGEDSEALLLTTYTGAGSKVYRVGADGKDRKELFKSTDGANYIYVSGNSKRGPLVVVKRETRNGKPEDQINLCEVGSNSCQPIAETEHGYKGYGVLSPDSRQVVFTMSPPEPYGRHRLWIYNLETRETQQLTKDTPADNQSWDSYPLWRPDGKEIAFIRAIRGASSIATSLQRVPASGGEPTPLLSTNEPIAGYCYSPDGLRLAAFTSRGLELIDLSSEDRTILLGWGSIPDRKFHASGIVWFRIHNTIAFALHNDKTNEFELWSVPADGKPASVLYKQPASQMTVSSNLSS